MKKKDIVVVVISFLVMSVSFYFLYKMVFPKKVVNNTVTQNQETEKSFNGKIDKETYSKIKDYKDYGEAQLDNIGRVNPFGTLN